MTGSACSRQERAGESVQKGPAVPIFSRSQVKYGLSRTDYAWRWVDRPLLIDPSLGDAESLSPIPIDEADFFRMQETAMKYGLAGFGFFAQSARRDGVYAVTEKASPHGFQLLTDFVPSGGEERKIELAGEALKSPHSFRINGKVVIVSYLAGNRTPAYWADLFRKIRERHGDHFIFLPALDWFAGKSMGHWAPRFRAGSLTESEEAEIKEDLRKWARATDGLYTAAAHSYKQDRQFDAAIYRDFVIRYMKEVLAEPEFVGRKYLGLSACVGHENCTRIGYTLSSNGTATLRESLETALAARPDLIVIPEWDEQNENTSLRPTVYNGRTMMRLLRHYTAGEAGTLQQPLESDDLEIPNIILSYRKIITLGEKLRLELLAIPENGVKGGGALTLELWNDRGEKVYTSKDYPIAEGKLWAQEETLASEAFGSTHYLLPKLVITKPSGKQQRFEEGFHAIGLRGTWNWDYKWVMQPLRELLRPKHVRFEVANKPHEGFSGVLMAHVEIETEEPLAYVEILDNDDVIYSHSLEDALPREDDQTAVFRLIWQSLEWQDKAQKLKGKIGVKGAVARWFAPEMVRTNQGTLDFEGKTASMRDERAYLSVTKERLDEAVLAVDLPGIWQGEVPLKQIYDHGIFGIPGPVGFNLVISRHLRQDHAPRHLNRQAVEFTVPVIPDLPRSRVQLQALTVDGKIYRSKPMITGADRAQEEELTLYSDQRKGPVKVRLDATLVPDINYRFRPDEAGSVLTTEAGRPFWGILGGYTTQATGRGGAEGRDGTPFINTADYPAAITNTVIADYEKWGTSSSSDTDVQSAPHWRRLPEGGFSLRFNGKSTFVALPQGVIPRRSGYEIAFDLKPDHTEGRQLIIANRAHYEGTLSVYSEGGILKARFFNEAHQHLAVNSKLKLIPGEWNRVSISYDLKTIRFHLNGAASDPLPLPGPGMYDMVTVVGGYGKEWFAGELKSLRIRHAVPPNH